METARRRVAQGWQDADYSYCSIEHCDSEVPDGVAIALCSRHLQKAWAAYQVITGAEVPEPSEDPEPNLYSMDAAGAVYIIRVGDLIKIGWTSNVASRFAQLRPDAVLHVEAGTRRDEARLHSECSDHLARGREWFHSTPEMIEYVNQFLTGRRKVAG